MPSLYLAGPMHGLPRFNVAEFRRVARLLTDVGYYVVNPADLDHVYPDLSPVDLDDPATFTEAHRQRAMLSGVRSIVGASYFDRDYGLTEDDPVDGVAFLDGWHRSRGALLEVSVAQAVGIRAEHWERWLADGLAAYRPRVLQGMP